MNKDNLPKIDRKDIEFIWEMNYYDGMLSGIAKYNGQPVYFFFPGSEDEDDYRYYLMSKLTEEEFKNLSEDHELFREHVGTHCDLGPNGKKLKGGRVHPEKNWKNYYDAPRIKVSMSNRPEDSFVGWFE